MIIVVGALPMLLVSVPSAADYPNHLARHHIFAALGRGSELASYFAVDWRWVGNLGVDLPVLLLTPVLGVEIGTRLVSALIVPLTVAGILMLSRATHGRVTGSAMLALPFALAQPFLFGFLNYCLSVALALIVAAAWNAEQRRGFWPWAGFGIAAVVVWTAHIMGWAILLVLVGGAELARTRSVRDLLARALRTSPLLLPMIPLMIWRAGEGGRLFWYAPDLFSSKVMNFATALKGLSMPLDLGMTAVIGVAATVAFLWSGRRKLEPRLATGGGLLLLAALLLPTTVLGSWGADLRLTPVAMMIAIMAVGPAADPKREKLIVMIGASLFVLRVGWTAAQWWHADSRLKARLELLNAVPAGSRFGFLSVDGGCGTQWTLTPDRKLGAYAVVRRNSFTNTLFQIPGADLMTLRLPRDRAIWFDGSQDIPRLCPANAPNIPLLEERMAKMRAHGFTALWVAGLPPEAVPALAGYVVAYRQGNDTLLLQRRD